MRWLGAILKIPCSYTLNQNSLTENAPTSATTYAPAENWPHLSCCEMARVSEALVFNCLFQIRSLGTLSAYHSFVTWDLGMRSSGGDTDIFEVESEKKQQVWASKSLSTSPTQKHLQTGLLQQPADQHSQGCYWCHAEFSDFCGAPTDRFHSMVTWISLTWKYSASRQSRLSMLLLQLKRDTQHVWSIQWSMVCCSYCACSFVSPYNVPYNYRTPCASVEQRTSH